MNRLANRTNPEMAPLYTAGLVVALLGATLSSETGSANATLIAGPVSTGSADPGSPMLRRLCLVPLLALASPVLAQDPFAGHRGGDLVIYGNYCGPGQRGRNPKPIDALDAACMRHDACTPVGALAPCRCHARLRREAERIAVSPAQTEEVRAMAGLVSQAAGLMACR